MTEERIPRKVMKSWNGDPQENEREEDREVAGLKESAGNTRKRMAKPTAVTIGDQKATEFALNRKMMMINNCPSLGR